MINEIFKEFKNAINSTGLKIKDESISKLIDFYGFLYEENKSYNLTAITSVKEVAIKHFADSLMVAIVPCFSKVNKILDVGSGAGFPGIPLAICNSDKHFTLLDSLTKRVNFLNKSAEILDLQNLVAIHERAEVFSKTPEHREQYELVTARAVADLSILCEYCLPAVKINGYFISMKSNDIADEIENSKKAIEILGGEIIDIISYKLEKDRISKLIIIKKVANTPDKYPRRPGMPKKRPLK